MLPEEAARQVIDRKLVQSGWIIQDMTQINLSAALGVAVREFPTSTGEVDYALFIASIPVGVVEAKRSEYGEKITSVEVQSSRYTGLKSFMVRAAKAVDRLLLILALAHFFFSCGLGCIMPFHSGIRRCRAAFVIS